MLAREFSKPHRAICRLHNAGKQIDPSETREFCARYPDKPVPTILFLVHDLEKWSCVSRRAVQNAHYGQETEVDSGSSWSRG